MAIREFLLFSSMLVLLSSSSLAQPPPDLVPRQAPHCAVAIPPDSAGLAATPGGWVMVFPRNLALRKDYSGCKVLWIVDGERYLRFATLVFERGVLRTAVAYDIRSAAGEPEAACRFPEGKSLMPNTGRKMADTGCAGLGTESFYGLYLPTWPRMCMHSPDSAECSRAPD